MIPAYWIAVPFSVAVATACVAQFQASMMVALLPPAAFIGGPLFTY
jgi:hypothetical protein